MADSIEKIMDKNEVLAIIIHSTTMPDQTTFLTPSDYKQQVGFIVYPNGGEIARHTHVPLQRHLVGTSEVILVRSGRCLLDVYNRDQKLVCTRELGPWDLMLMVGGGHGFRMLEDTVLIEIKQGPYTGIEEKERF